MEIYDPNVDVTVTLPFVGSDDRTVTPTALDYLVTDETGAEIVALTNIPVFVVADAQHKITVVESDNTLAADVVRGYRQVELRITTATDVFWVRQGYIIEIASTLSVLTNSFQTYEEALLGARDIYTLEGWNYADEQHRKSALAQAYDRFLGFSYRFTYTDDQYEEKTIPELEAAEWAILNGPQKQAFKQAQILQANYLLGGSPIEEDIDKGLQSSTIGEVSQFYRPRATLTLPLSRDTLQYVGRYIIWSPRITRT